MSIVAFTGPSRRIEGDYAAATAALWALDYEDIVVTGGAFGWDTLIADIALDRPHAVEIVCPAAPYFASGVLVAEERGAVVTRLNPLPGVEPYRRRNREMIRRADRLVAAVVSETFYRSGEWMTINLARKAGIPVEKVILPD